MNACGVLDELVAGDGFQPGENKTARNECVATKTRYGSAGVVLDPVQGLEEFRRTDPDSVEIKINGRQALRSHDSDGFCDIAMKVSESARAIVGVSPVGSADFDACTDTKKYAEELEPMLPKVQ
ncbi:hypothetical protein GCM10027521_48880 [Amycolatopsis cihanbeyliensis]